MLELIDVSAGFDRPVLHSVDLTIHQGDRIAVLGANGSGKSTLLKCLCGQVSPDKGSILLDGALATGWQGRRRLRGCSGLVGQDPDNQIVSSIVFDEVAFGPCNLGWSPEEIRLSVKDALATCDLQGLERRDVATLSGGQRQRVALAGILAMGPRCILLDEPCAMLDALGRQGVLRALATAHELGSSIVHVTHDLEDVIDYDRVVVLESGKIAWKGSPLDFLLDERAIELAACHLSLWTKVVRDLVARGIVRDPEALLDPLSCAASAVSGGFVPDRLWEHAALKIPGNSEAIPSDQELAARSVSFGYAVPANDGPTVRDINLALHEGKVVLMAGPTGSGKSTVAKLLAGLLRPDEGAVVLNGQHVEAGNVGYAFQMADDQLFADTVLEDVAFGPKNRGMRRVEALDRAREALLQVGLSPDRFGDASPFALSGGQRRRVALAGVFAMGLPYVVLDEPTVGLDAPGFADLIRIVEGLTSQGTGVLIVSHDVERFLPLADEVVVMRDGDLVWSGEPGAARGSWSQLHEWGLGSLRFGAFVREVARLWGSDGEGLFDGPR